MATQQYDGTNWMATYEVAGYTYDDGTGTIVTPGTGGGPTGGSASLTLPPRRGGRASVPRVGGS